MIRWSYLLPRVLVLLVLLTAAHYGIPLVLRWGMIHAIETATRRQADVQQAWGSLVRGEVRVRGVQIARSASSDRNLFQCDSATLALNLDALAHQRLVVDDAQIRGIRLDTQRHFDAAGSSRISIPTLETPDMSQLARRGEALSRAWLERATELLQRRVEEEFQSLQTARQLAQRWPQDYRAVQEQVRQCHASALQLYQALTAIPSASKMSENLAQLQQRWQDVVQLRQQIMQLQERVKQLTQQIERDRASIAAAFETDREKLRQKMTLARLDEKRLNNYLLDAEIQLWWSRLQPWLEFARWLNDSPDMNQLGQRGSVVQFGTDGPQPRFLLRSATLDGQLCLAGHQVDFLGRAQNWAIAADPKSTRQEHPARLQLVTRGPLVARLAAELDCVDGVPRRQFAVECDSMPLEARRWGSDRGWTVSVAPGATHLRARLIATGDSVNGRIQLVQNEIQLSVTPVSVTPGDSGSQDALWQPLAQAASGIEQFQLSAHLTGTVDAPQWEIESNLGSQLQQQFQTAVEQLVREHTERLVAEAERRLQTQVEQWKQQLPAPPEQLQQQLAATQQLLSSLPQPVASRLQPLGQLLRRF